MVPAARLLVLVATLVSPACAAGATGATGAAAGTPEALRTFWPEGVPTPKPPRAAPTIGASEKGTEALQIAYEPPHLRFQCMQAPEGTFSVIYLVASKRHRNDRLQIDSVIPESSFTGMLEYDRLVPGEYTVTAYAKGVAEPLDARTITVPD